MRRAASSSIASLTVAAVGALAAACMQVQDFRTSPNDLGDAAAPPVVAPDAGCGSANDPENCGVCGRSCLGGECREGVCQPFVIAENVGLDPNDKQVTDQGAFGVAADDSYVYFMDLWSEVFRVPAKPHAGKPESLAQTKASPSFLTLHGEHLYFGGIDPPVGRVKTSGGGIEAVSPPSAGPTDQAVSFAIDGDAVVWVDSRGRVLRCSTVPCASAEVVRDYDALFHGKYHPVAVASTQGRVYASYFSDSDTGAQLLGVDGITTGGAVPLLPVLYQQLVAEPSGAGDFDVVFGVGQQLIARALTVGPFTNTVLASGAALDEYPRVASDGDWLYFVNHRVCPEQDTACSSPYGSIMRVKKDGSSLPETILRTNPGLHALAIHGRALYFTTDAGRVLGLAKPVDPQMPTR